MSLIELTDIHKTYRVGDVNVPVLKGVSLSVEAGELVAIMGASGSGKSTLMNVLGCLDRPDRGSYSLEGVDVTKLAPRQVAQLRSSRIGFVFQSFHLLLRSTALENVMMPAAYSAERRSRSDTKETCVELLRMMGLEPRMHHTPLKLSGGEQQRVAIARSLVNHPTVLLADEPTGNLDSKTGREILEIFRRLNREKGVTILLVTHDQEVANHADRIIRIADGRIVEDAAPASSASRSPREARPVALAGRRRRNALNMVLSAVRIAFQGLRRSPSRTLLTMLGVIIGVASVISMMEINRGAFTAIEVTVTNMGANLLAVLPGAPQHMGETSALLTPEDAESIRRDLLQQ